MAGPAEQQPPGQWIGDYQILGVIDQGGMGIVYEVRDLLGNILALKMTRGPAASTSFLQRFFLEAKTMAEIRHPNLVAIRHYGVHEGRPYFVMKRYGGNLASRLNEKRRTWTEVAALVAKIADGVACMHARGYVHRDLKPKNILFDGAEPVVADLGLAKPIGQEDTPSPSADESGVPGSASGCQEAAQSTQRRPDLTQHGTVLGTRAYMSPEQAAGKIHEANPTWDVWALGIILQELALGRPPASAEEGKDDPPIEPRLRRVIDRCLAPRPEERFADAAALAQELTAVATSARRRRGYLIGAAALALLAIFSVVAWAVLHAPTIPSHEDPPPSLSDRLHKGETVTLVGDTGEPDYKVFREGKDEANLRQFPDDGAFTVDTLGLAMIELAPPGCCPDGFRLKGKVRVNLAYDVRSRGGFYVGHDLRHDEQGARRHYFAELSFIEAIPGKLTAKGKRQGQWSYGMRYLTATPPADHPAVFHGGMIESRLPKLVESTPESWRDLMIEIRPDAGAFAWEGVHQPDEALGSQTNTLNVVLRTAKLPAPNPPLEMGPKQGFGLYIRQASVSFRSVTVEPLPNKDR